IEMNQVLAVDGAILWLTRFVERAYDTSPTVRRMVKLPRVYIQGIAQSYEIDAGEAWAGGSGAAPNLISLRYTYRSLVEDMSVDEFRAFAIHMQHSVDPITRRVEAKNC